jgi:hypothetical protein
MVGEGSSVMKQLKKISAVWIAIVLFVQSISMLSMDTNHAHAAELTAPKLLSGNTLGQVYSENATTVIETGATYAWQQVGLHSTDSGLIAADPVDASLMTDGSVSVISKTASQSGSAYGTLVYDLKAVYRVTTVDIWSEFSAASGLKQAEIYASMDGVNYNLVAVKESTLADDAGIALVNSNIKPAPYARYVKVVLHKNPAKLTLGIGEVAIWGDVVEAPAILSNNQLKAGGYYAPGTPKLSPNTTYKWSTDQPFVTQAGLITSDNESGAKNDGSVSGLPDLTDGSSTEQTADTTASMATGTQGQYGTVTFTLNDIYQIGNIDVWSKADSDSYMDGYEVLLSTDNINYFSSGYTANPNSRYSDAMVNSPSKGVPGKHARYVRIVMHNANDSNRLVAGEIAIWGWKLYDAALTKTDTPEQVEFTTYLKNYNTLYLDWSAYNAVVNKVNKYSVYIRKSDFTTTSGIAPHVTADNGTPEQKGKFLLISSLEPETTYYIAITPTSTATGERKDVSTIRIKTPSVLGGEKIGDIFAINDTPYGGGNYVHHGAKEDENIIRKLVLMRSIEGINMNRWWIHDSWVKTFSNKYGVGFHTFYHGPQDVTMENKQGTWSFSTVNEPDLKGTNPAALALQFKANHESLKAVDSRNLLVEPALGGTEPASMTWLENLYKSDGQNGALVKTYFDVLDVHPYVKNHEGSLPGLIPGAPEMLLGKIKEIEALKAKYGDQDKPVIFTELGWSTYTGSSYLRPVNRITQRNYLARAYMHAIAGGIKRLHWYDFQDDGLDGANLEHNLGLIDWYGTPKPSYYAYYTLAKVLKDAKYVGVKANVDHPYYGYEYWHEGKNQYITSLWAADESTKTATFRTQDAGLTVVGIDGSYTYLPVSDGMASLTINGAPVFIYSSTGLEIASIDDSFVLKNTSLDVRRGDVLQTAIHRSGMGAQLSGRLELIGPNPEWQLEGDVNFTAGTTAIPISIRVPLNAEEKETELTLQVISGTSLVASMKLKAKVLETIKVRVAPEVAVPGQWDQWNAVLYLENATENKVLSGTISVTDAVYLALEQAGPIAISELMPGEIKKITIPITELPEQARAKLKLAVELDSGFTKIVERPFNFIAAVNDQTTPVVDGNLSEASWLGSMPIVINRPDQNKNIAGWNGEQDLSGKGYLKWDRNHLYFGMEVQDDVHHQKGTGGDMWQGDSIQFAIDTGRANGVGSAENNEFGIALGEQGPIVWRWLASNGNPIGEMPTAQAAVSRNGLSTSYELAIPWAELLPEGKPPADGDILGFSMLINENDGTTRRGWLEYMSGIGSSKNTQLFEDLIFTQVGAPEVRVTGVALDRPAVAVNQGEAIVLNASVNPSDATNKKVRFISSDPAVASVTQEVYGMQAAIAGVSAGTAIITVTTEDGGYTASSTVTVKTPQTDNEVRVTGVTLNRSTINLHKGQAITLNAKVQPSNATNQQVHFTSSDSAVVSVTQEVYKQHTTITGVSAGTATITVTTVEGGFAASSRVTVEVPSTDDDTSGDVSYGGGIPTPASEPPKVQDGTILVPTPELTQDGLASAEVSMAVIQEAIDGATATAERILAIDIPEVQGAAKIQFRLPAAALDTAQSAGIERVQIRTGLATIALTPEALSEHVKSTSANVDITVELIHSDELAGEAANRVGGKPVYDFKVMLDGVQIDQFQGKHAMQISMNYTLSPGENANQVVVYYIRDGHTLEVMKNGKYDAATGQVTFTTQHFSLYTALYNPITFGDLQDAAWATSAIEALAAKEIVNGMGSDVFAPNDRVTRAQYIQMLMNAFDLTDSKAAASFNDVAKNDWFFQAVASAEKLGIVQGYEDGSFGVNREITRQEMAVMAYRVVALAQVNLKKSVKPMSFIDQADIGSYAQEAVISMQEAGIIQGLEGDRFAPGENATRAQAAKIIYYLLSK